MTTSRIGFARSFALIAAAVAVPLAGLGLAPVAGATQTTSFASCDTTPSTTNHIWDGVNPDKGYTPAKSGNGNALIVWPHDDQSRGYAVHYGDDAHNTHNLLVVPTVRELGIECSNLLGDAPEYFTHAYDQRNLMTGKDWVLAINSKSGRRVDQLHIHLTQLDSNTRADIDKAFQDGKVATTEQDWWKSTAMVRGTTTKGGYTERGVRMWHAPTMNHNFFAKLNDDIVKKSQQAKFNVSMADETLLITSAPGGKGFIVLTSDEVSGLKGGVNNVETFLHKT